VQSWSSSGRATTPQPAQVFLDTRIGSISERPSV
jgi:hypothetical protein